MVLKLADYLPNVICGPKADDEIQLKLERNENTICLSKKLHLQTTNKYIFKRNAIKIETLHGNIKNKNACLLVRFFVLLDCLVVC